MSNEVIIIIASLLFSAFFSGMEIAYISSNKIHIEIEKKQRGLLARILTKLTVKPSKLIATMLIGNNIWLFTVSLWEICSLIGFKPCCLPATI
jgi:putative hemolysin